MIYCKESRLPTIETKPKLTQAIRQTFPNAQQLKERILGVGVWVWKYLKRKSVPTVPSVPCISLLENLDSNIRKETHGTDGTHGTDFICGQCALWHKLGCSYPDADFSCISPLNKYAVYCRDFIPKKDSGEVKP